jgi:hypothetical protein
MGAGTISVIKPLMLIPQEIGYKKAAQLSDVCQEGAFEGIEVLALRVPTFTGRQDGFEHLNELPAHSSPIGIYLKSSGEFGRI